jgi:hypothetical protein
MISEQLIGAPGHESEVEFIAGAGNTFALASEVGMQHAFLSCRDRGYKPQQNHYAPTHTWLLQ